MTGKQAIRSYERVEKHLNAALGALFMGTNKDSDSQETPFDFDPPNDMEATIQAWLDEIGERAAEIQDLIADAKKKK